MPKPICSIDGCESLAHGRGWCNKHYKRWLLHGTTDDPRPTTEDRFWSYVEKSDGCWQWLGYPDRQGYGQFTMDGRRTTAHRASFVIANGPVPADVEIDHLCHNRGCVNPDHLREVTPGQNQQNRSGAQRNNLSSGVRGVAWHTIARKWSISVQYRGKHHYGGLFENLEDAEAAVIALRNRLYTHNDLDRVA